LHFLSGLDAIGNVTKAASSFSFFFLFLPPLFALLIVFIALSLAKGYAVGGSALACFVLFQAFLDEITVILGTAFNSISMRFFFQFSLSGLSDAFFLCRPGQG
jgi:hypothetical protein